MTIELKLSDNNYQYIKVVDNVGKFILGFHVGTSPHSDKLEIFVPDDCAKNFLPEENKIAVTSLNH